MTMILLILTFANFSPFSGVQPKLTSYNHTMPGVADCSNSVHKTGASNQNMPLLYLIFPSSPTPLYTCETIAGTGPQYSLSGLVNYKSSKTTLFAMHGAMEFVLRLVGNYAFVQKS